jgi:hypothetical protein
MKNAVARMMTVEGGEAMVFLHTARAPSQEEWAHSMQMLERAASTGSFSRIRVLVVTDGGGPDVVMRSELQALFKKQGHSPKTAVVTTSVLSRGIVTAVSWFNPNIKAFAPIHFGQALEHIGLPRAATRLLRELAEMEGELGLNSCLSLVRNTSVSAQASQ